MDSPVAIVVGTGSRHFTQGLVREELWLRVQGTPVTLLRVRTGAADVLLLERHGPRHCYLPHEIPYEAHAHALAMCGIRWVVGISAVGSMRHDIQPGSVVVLDDFIGYRETRSPSHAGAVAVSAAHMVLDEPYCQAVRTLLVKAVPNCVKLWSSGTYLEVKGPRFETPAEIRMYACLGADVVGMTGVQELLACRTAGLCYAGLACVTNFGTGMTPEPPRHDGVEETMGGILRAIARPVLQSAASGVSSGLCYHARC